MSMKNSSDTIGNRTRDLPACSSVPQPTAPPRDHQPGHRKKKCTCKAFWYQSESSKKSWLSIKCCKLFFIKLHLFRDVRFLMQLKPLLLQTVTCDIISNNVGQHNTLLHNVIAWATCFDYLSVILRPIFCQLSHNMLCTLRDSNVLTCMETHKIKSFVSRCDLQIVFTSVRYIKLDQFYVSIYISMHCGIPQCIEI